MLSTPSAAISALVIRPSIQLSSGIGCSYVVHVVMSVLILGALRAPSWTSTLRSVGWWISAGHFYDVMVYREDGGFRLIYSG